MAYKFQLGAAKLSGSIEQTDGSSIKAQTELQIGSVAVDETELGILEGATVTTAELNYLDNSDLEAADIQKLADITATAAEINDLAGNNVGAADFTKLAAVTSTAAELNLVDTSVAGTIVNSKAVIYGSSGEVNGTSFQVSGNEVISSGGAGTFNNVEIDGYLSASSHVSASAISLVDASGLAGEGLANESGALRMDVSALGALTSNIIAGASDLFLVYDNDQQEHKKMTSQEYVQAIVDADAGSPVSGLSESGAKLQVNVDDSSIEINSNSLRVKASGVSNAMLANDSISLGGVSIALGATDATPAFDLSDAASYPGDSSLLTVGALAAGSIASGFGAINNGASAITTTGTGSFGKLVVSGDFEVQGDLTYIDTTNLRVSDAKVVFADGAAALAAGQGWYIGSDAGDATEKASFAVSLDVDGVGTDGFQSSLPIKASRFYGELVGSMVETVQTLTAAATIDAGNGTTVLLNHGTAQSFVLPSASSLQGSVLKLKRIGAGNCTITTPGSETIDGEASILIESSFGAVNIISNGTNYFVI
jgi:hypothetical protein